MTQKNWQDVYRQLKARRNSIQTEINGLEKAARIGNDAKTKHDLAAAKKRKASVMAEISKLLSENR